MPLAFVPYTQEHVPAVRAFNQRLLAGGILPEDLFPETPDPGWFPDMHLYLALEDSEVRGAYILRRQTYSVSRETRKVNHYRLPLSEGVIDRKYATLGLLMVRDALAREPLLYASGMGGWHNALPSMLKRLKWRMCEVPFYFQMVNPAAFLRNIQVLRTSALRRFAMDVAAATGTGWLGMKVLGFSPRVRCGKADLAKNFAGWGDEVWERSRNSYGLLANRDAATLDAIYPQSDARFLRVRAAGGWAVVLDTQMSGHKQFGDMRLGTIVDCMARPEDAGQVVRAAAGLLQERGVDLIISNQLHKAWSRGLLDTGFRSGPSNYLFALSPAFAAAAGPLKDNEFHFNRGDGDGPIHL